MWKWNSRLFLFVRRFCAAAVFLLLSLLFISTSSVFLQAAQCVAALQIIPALMTASWLGLILLALATLLFGRAYCSFFCPLGILQDLLARLFARRKRKHRHFRPPAKLMRPVIAVFFAAALAFGNTVLVTLLDPYSLYGIMAVNLFKQGWTALNNALVQYSWFASLFVLYPLPYSNLTIVSFLTALALLAFFMVFVLLRGREYCSSICPVGTVLGWLGRYALFRVRFEANQCTHCRRCEQVCKTSCIDSGALQIDYSRCVLCFNCLPVCSHNAVHYGLSKLASKAGHDSTCYPVGKEKTEQVEDDKVVLVGINADRRRFVGLHLAVLAAISGVGVPLFAQARKVHARATEKEAQVALTPPGSRSRAHFIRHCTACQLCVARCPTRVLRPSLGEYGLLQILQPRMDFGLGYCNYDCVICSELCPSGAILPLSIQEKHETQTGNVHFIQHLCVVESKLQSCGACAEHCPSLAVKMVTYNKAPHLTIPEITPDLCVGCGACEHACPVLPDKAIYVQGLLRHQKARILPRGQQIHRQMDSFGF